VCHLSCGYEVFLQVLAEAKVCVLLVSMVTRQLPCFPLPTPLWRYSFAKQVRERRDVIFFTSFNCSRHYSLEAAGKPAR
jgi:hypothetical protein